MTSPKMGSRKGQTTIYYDSTRAEVVCGCFTGTLDEFKVAIDATHGDNHHGVEYRKWLTSFEKYREESND